MKMDGTHGVLQNNISRIEHLRQEQHRPTRLECHNLVCTTRLLFPAAIHPRDFSAALSAECSFCMLHYVCGCVFIGKPGLMFDFASSSILPLLTVLDLSKQGMATHTARGENAQKSSVNTNRTPKLNSKLLSHKGKQWGFKLS